MKTLQLKDKDFVLVNNPVFVDRLPAVKLRAKYPSSEAYVQEMTSLTSMAYIYDSWQGSDNEKTDTPRPKPVRPADYLDKDDHWSLVDWEHAFNGYELTPKLLDLVNKGELFFAPKIKKQ